MCGLAKSRRRSSKGNLAARTWQRCPFYHQNCSPKKRTFWRDRLGRCWDTGYWFFWGVRVLGLLASSRVNPVLMLHADYSRSGCSEELLLTGWVIKSYRGWFCKHVFPPTSSGERWEMQLVDNQAGWDRVPRPPPAKCGEGLISGPRASLGSVAGFFWFKWD